MNHSYHPIDPEWVNPNTTKSIKTYPVKQVEYVEAQVRKLAGQIHADDVRDALYARYDQLQAELALERDDAIRDLHGGETPPEVTPEIARERARREKARDKYAKHPMKFPTDVSETFVSRKYNTEAYGVGDAAERFLAHKAKEAGKSYTEFARESGIISDSTAQKAERHEARGGAAFDPAKPTKPGDPTSDDSETEFRQPKLIRKAFEDWDGGR